uniref:Uncharacterized protein n=1 Tax=Cacopsylla melanoneura TaxID=428564 RepID=A0A8D8UGQ9_9HEMI
MLHCAGDCNCLSSHSSPRGRSDHSTGRRNWPSCPYLKRSGCGSSCFFPHSSRLRVRVCCCSSCPHLAARLRWLQQNCPSACHSATTWGTCVSRIMSGTCGGHLTLSCHVWFAWRQYVTSVVTKAAYVQLVFT